MLENEFDKGIKDRLGELQLTPSATVWPEVERRIRERKKRRILFFWMLLAGILVSGLAILTMKSSSGLDVLSKNEETKRSPLQHASVEAKKKDSLIDVSGTAALKIKSHVDDTSTVKANVTKDPVVSANKVNAEVNGVQKSNVTKRNSTMDPVINGVGPTIVYTAGNGTKKKNKKSMSSQLPLSINNTAVETNQQVLVGDLPLSASEHSAPLNKESIVSVSMTTKNDTLITAKIQEPVSVTEVKPVIAQKLKKRSVWETGISISAGFTRLTNGELVVFNEKAADLAYTSPLGMNSNANTASPLIRLADTMPLYGWSWQAGVYAKRKINKRLFFSAGINTGYYSVRQTVGAFVDSSRRYFNVQSAVSGSNYYLSGTQTVYSNRYYYLQLPLLFHWRFGKSGKSPLFEWENGLMPVFLAGTRALVYDRTERLYYTDKKVYNRLGLVYQTGFSILADYKEKHPWSVGLFYNYHITQLQKNNQPSFNNLSSFGLQFRRVIKK